MQDRFVHTARPVYADDVAVPDAQFRLGVAASGLVLVAVITGARFCGSASLPPKPARMAGPSGPARSLIAKGAASPAVYQDFLERDAASAGTRVPSIESMSRKLPYRVDEVRHVLEVGAPPIELAGLRLTVGLEGTSLMLSIENLTDGDLAYAVATTPTPNISGCNAAPAQLFNAMVIAKGATERRVECVYREGMALAINKVETLEVSALSAWYIALVPPALVGVEARIARGHRAPETSEKCSTSVSQVVRSGLDSGQIGWRDLVDFYARHRCATYRFPSAYRAFKEDGERALPATAESM